MKAKQQKKLILSLIRDYLVNTRLLLGLDELGFDTSHYCLSLGEAIFDLMGLEEKGYNEELYLHFIEISERVKFIDFKDSFEKLDALALDIYNELMQHKSSR